MPPPGLTGSISWGAGQLSWSMRAAVPQYRHVGGTMMQDGEDDHAAVYYGATAEPLQSYQNSGSLEQKGVLHPAWPMLGQAKKPMMGQANVVMTLPSFPHESKSVVRMHDRIPQECCMSAQAVCMQTERAQYLRLSK